MLVEFSVSNFLSIKERSTLSLVKSSMKGLEKTNVIEVEAPSTPDILRGAVIFGPNAAGKSNLIKAFGTLTEIVEDSAREWQSGENLPVTPFLFDDESIDNPSEFEVTFIAQGVRYTYGFAATKQMVTEEWLYAYPKGRAQRWIERIYDTEKETFFWGTMDKLSGKKQLWQDATRPNALFLSTAIQLNSQQLKPVYEWLVDKLRVAGLGTWSRAFTMKMCEDDLEKKKVMNFLEAADVSISDVVIKEDNFNSDFLPDDMPDSVREDIIKQFEGKKIVEAKTVHLTSSGRKVLLDLDDESDGTKKIFALAAPWLESLEKGYVLVIDELHDNLHPLMVNYLVGLFNNPATNPNNAQLIFTTHDTSLLDQDVFRRDQIWFCEKDNAQTTKFYPLTDFNPRKGVENLERGYLAGRYGALPFINGRSKG